MAARASRTRYSLPHYEHVRWSKCHHSIALELLPFFLRHSLFSLSDLLCISEHSHLSPSALSKPVRVYQCVKLGAMLRTIPDDGTSAPAGTGTILAVLL